MSKQLENLFELASDESNELAALLPEQTKAVTEEALTNLEKIEQALPQVRNLDATDEEMDELAELAKNSFKDLQDLGLQVEARFSSEIFSAASSLLGHAISAKTAKINSKLKRIELQLKKAALDLKKNEKQEEIDNTPIGEGKALDRNEILRALSSKGKE